MSEFQESNSTWRRLRLQQILYKSVLDNDLDMVLKCVQHGADIREEYHPVSATCDTLIYALMFSWFRTAICMRY